MALSKDDSWYVPLPDSRTDPAMRRYNRALALSRMQHEVEMYEKRPDAHPRRRQAIEHRRYCLANWQAYLDGTIDPPTGRKMKGD